MRSLSALVLALAVICVAPKVWHAHQRAAFQREVNSLADGNGFIPVHMPDGAEQGTVLILAPRNCPSAQARRADALAGELTRAGIPNRRTATYFIARASRGDQAEIARALDLMRLDRAPVVMIDDRAKANPTTEEVVAEFRHRD